MGPDRWPGPLPWSVLPRWLRTASTAAQTAEKTGETTGETGERTAGTVADPTRRKAPRRCRAFARNSSASCFAGTIGLKPVHLGQPNAKLDAEALVALARQLDSLIDAAPETRGNRLTRDRLRFPESRRS